MTNAVWCCILIHMKTTLADAVKWVADGNFGRFDVELTVDERLIAFDAVCEAHGVEITERDPSRVYGARVYPGYPGRIVVASVTGWGVQVREFGVGDLAEYDSYNYSFFGEIVSVTPKTVSIRPRGQKATKRLTIVKFTWRNVDFDVVETMARNDNALQSL